MPQLDRLLSVMVSNRAEALRLVENELASLVKDGASVPVTKQALGASQLLGLLREIAPPDALQHLDNGAPAEFEYRSSDGVFTARASNESGKWMAAITGVNPAVAGTVSHTSGASVARSRPTPSLPSAGVPAPAATSTVQVKEDHTARAAIDNLLRTLV